MGRVKNSAGSEVLKNTCRFKNEAEFESWVIEVLRLNGWLVTSMKDSRKQHWNTHKGVPDIIAVHAEDHVVLFAELKMPGKCPTPAQEEWGKALTRVEDHLAYCEMEAVIYYVWYPKDEDWIVRLAGGKRPLW